VKGICHKRRRKTESVTVGQDSAESIQKIITVMIIEKNLSSVNPPHNDMLQRSRGIYAGFSRHVNGLPNKSEFVKRKSEVRPRCPAISIVVKYFPPFNSPADDMM